MSYTMSYEVTNSDSDWMNSITLPWFVVEHNGKYLEFIVEGYETWIAGQGDKEVRFETPHQIANAFESAQDAFNEAQEVEIDEDDEEALDEKNLALARAGDDLIRCFESLEEEYLEILWTKAISLGGVTAA